MGLHLLCLLRFAMLRYAVVVERAQVLQSPDEQLLLSDKALVSLQDQLEAMLHALPVQGVVH